MSWFRKAFKTKRGKVGSPSAGDRIIVWTKNLKECFKRKLHSGDPYNHQLIYYPPQYVFLKGNKKWYLYYHQ